jgi:hypothetical protein
MGGATKLKDASYLLTQAKFAASLVSPLPLYFAAAG